MLGRFIVDVTTYVGNTNANPLRGEPGASQTSRVGKMFEKIKLIVSLSEKLNRLVLLQRERIIDVQSNFRVCLC